MSDSAMLDKTYDLLSLQENPAFSALRSLYSELEA